MEGEIEMEINTKINTKIKTVMKFIISLLVFSACTLSWAQEETGRKRAQRYFAKDAEERSPASSDASSGGSRYLAIHYGQFMNSTAYKWGEPAKENNVGLRTYGVTYRIGEWVRSMDLLLRVEFGDYNVDNFYNQKLSFSTLVAFPDANSGFPLYFGAGIGGGVYFRQMNKESSLTFDYQLIMGARFMDIYDGVGFFVETGLKNHLHILSDGQFNGTFLSGGAVFEF